LVLPLQTYRIRDLFWKTASPLCGPNQCQSFFDAAHSVPSRRLIVTDAAWHKYFHSDAHAVGQVIQVGGNAASVVAVMPAGQWRLPKNFDAWIIEDEQTGSAAQHSGTHGEIDTRLTFPRYKSADSFTRLP
jgi:hypothetical protein